jgi:hypothetical protein
MRMDLLKTFEISDSSRYLQDPVIYSSAQTKFIYRRLKKGQKVAEDDSGFVGRISCRGDK